MLFLSGSSLVLLKQLVAFPWLDKMGLAFLRKKAKPCDGGREVMYIWGKMKSGSITQLEMPPPPLLQ